MKSILTEQEIQEQAQAAYDAVIKELRADNDVLVQLPEPPEQVLHTKGSSTSRPHSWATYEVQTGEALVRLLDRFAGIMYFPVLSRKGDCSVTGLHTIYDQEQVSADHGMFMFKLDADPYGAELRFYIQATLGPIEIWIKCKDYKFEEALRPEITSNPRGRTENGPNYGRRAVFGRDVHAISYGTGQGPNKSYQVAYFLRDRDHLQQWLNDYVLTNEPMTKAYA